MWRLGRVEKLNKDSDCYIHTTKIYLPDGHYVQRSILQLHPLEVPDKPNEVDQISNEKEDRHSLEHAGHVQESDLVPIRKTAITARKRINDLRTNALTVIF